MNGGEFDRRWRRLVTVARRAPAPSLTPPATRWARLPEPGRAARRRLRLAAALAACAGLYAAALPLLESAIAAPPELKLFSLPRPPVLPTLPIARPPALPRPPTLPALSAVRPLSLYSKEGAHDPR